jgi:hypothetical protein
MIHLMPGNTYYSRAGRIALGVVAVLTQRVLDSNPLLLLFDYIKACFMMLILSLWMVHVANDSGVSSQ